MLENQGKGDQSDTAEGESASSKVLFPVRVSEREERNEATESVEEGENSFCGV